ncbi:MAG: amino acid racemase [Clostridia bacterium]|nr:amino acid racemase [Clostridia bacterium]
MALPGIIGGTSFHSTIDLYRFVNQAVYEAKGGYNCARLLLCNVNLQDILDQDTPAKKGGVLAEAAKRLEAGGATCFAVCSNGLHEYVPYAEKEVSIPLLHIADPTIAAIRARGFTRIGLMGAKDTMVHDFYKQRLIDAGIDVIIPSEPEMDYMESVLWGETNFGIVKPESAARFLQIAGQLYEAGAQGVILGCTEIGMLIKQEDTEIPLFDTTQLHAQAIADLCIKEDS